MQQYKTETNTTEKTCCTPEWIFKFRQVTIAPCTGWHEHGSAVVSYCFTQRSTGRGYPAMSHTWEEFLAVLRGLLHFELRGFSLSLFLLTLLSIRDRKGQVKFSLCLDNYLLPCWEPMCLNWFPSFLCQKRNYFLSWLILPWARAQKKTVNRVSLSGIILTELLSAPESAFLKPESPPPHLCWLGDG